MRRHISFFLYFLFLCCLWGCNTDNDITVPDRKPISVTFDNLSGVYELKTRKQLSITPAVENAVNPRYKWTNDEGKTVATGLTLTFSSETEGVFYFTFHVDADNGSASKEIRIDVLSQIIPTVTLPTAMQTTIGQGLTIVPAVNTGGDTAATYRWLLDNITAGSQPTFTFKTDKEGIITAGITAGSIVLIWEA